MNTIVIRNIRTNLVRPCYFLFSVLRLSYSLRASSTIIFMSVHSWKPYFLRNILYYTILSLIFAISWSFHFQASQKAKKTIFPDKSSNVLCQEDKRSCCRKSTKKDKDSERLKERKKETAENNVNCNFYSLSLCFNGKYLVTLVFLIVHKAKCSKVKWGRLGQS